MKDIGVTVNLQPIADQSALIDAAIGGEFRPSRGGTTPAATPTRSTCGGTTPTPPNPVNFGRFNDPEINRLLDEGRTTADPAQRKTIYEDLNKQFAKQLWNLWASYTIWSIATQPNVHGGSAALPDGSGPFLGLATGHPVSGMWVSK
jgi:peptide/nickel transport system substrate-binding protein